MSKTPLLIKPSSLEKLSDWLPHPIPAAAKVVWVSKDGRYHRRLCRYCGDEYETPMGYGPGGFCSRSCAGRGRVFDPVARFWSFVQKRKPEECWRWKGYCPAKDGPVFSIGDRTIRANRFSYLLNIGPIPAGMFVCHHCDNPWCMNPTHFFLGTSLENNRDCLAKGRKWIGVGEESPMAKLCHAEVIEIRELYNLCNVTHRELSQRFKVSQETIRKVICRKTWRHVA